MLLLGEAATPERVADAFGERAWRALHFACHAFVDPERPRLSGLVLSGGEVLDLDRIHGLRARADVVVLSACETGRGRLLAGEGVLGLVRGFFFAGAKRVVASSWKVADDDARLLMDVFYRLFAGEGRQAAAALRLAKRERMAAAPHPYHWAAFSLWGLPD
jgi:CHAT domain-containing protein